MFSQWTIWMCTTIHWWWIWVSLLDISLFTVLSTGQWTVPLNIFQYHPLQTPQKYKQISTIPCLEKETKLVFRGFQSLIFLCMLGSHIIKLITSHMADSHSTAIYATHNTNNSTWECCVLGKGMGMVSLVGCELWLAMDNYFICGYGGNWFLDDRSSNIHFSGSLLVRIMWSMELRI